MSVARGSVAWLALVACAISGCAATVDMATAASPERATMTVPYTNVREEVRLYPDYGPIDGSILTDADAPPAKPGDRPRGAAKKGKP